MSKPIHTYLDLDVVNNILTGDVVAPALRFEETRNTPFWKETVANISVPSSVSLSRRATPYRSSFPGYRRDSQI